MRVQERNRQPIFAPAPVLVAGTVDKFSDCSAVCISPCKVRQLNCISYSLTQDSAYLSPNATGSWTTGPPPQAHVKLLHSKDQDLHPKHPKLCRRRLIPPAHRRTQPLSQNLPRMLWRNDTVVPQSSGGKRGIAFPFDARFQLRVYGFSHRFHDGAELFGAHDADFGVGPHPEEAWGICAATVRRMSASWNRTYKISDEGTYHIP